MNEAAATPLEEWVQARARALLGPGVWLSRRVVVTRAGPRTGSLVLGYRIGRRRADGSEEVLGMSPPGWAPLDLSTPGGPEAALEDALRRGAAGLGPYRDEVCGAPVPPGEGAGPARKPDSEATTSSLALTG